MNYTSNVLEKSPLLPNEMRKNLFQARSIHFEQKDIHQD